MARFYATFNGSTNTNMESESGSNYYTLKTFTLSNGSDLAATASAARADLSNQMYAQLDLVNENGSRGFIIPYNSIQRSAGTFLSWSNSYTSSVSGVVWPADARIRPTGSIASESVLLTAVGDSGSISDLFYLTASNAINNILTGISGSISTRPGLNPTRTYHSIWHDHPFTFIAWDNFTPEQPGSLTAVTGSPATQIPGEPPLYATTIAFSWTPGIRSDKAAIMIMSGTLTAAGASDIPLPETSSAAGLNTFTYGVKVDGGYTWTVAAASIRFVDPVITSHTGSSLNVTNLFSFYPGDAF